MPPTETTLTPDTPFGSDVRAHAFVRRNPEGGTIREIARVLGMTPKTCESTERRALAKLRSVLLPLVASGMSEHEAVAWLLGQIGDPDGQDEAD